MSGETTAYRNLATQHSRTQAKMLLLQRVLHLFAVPDDFDAVFEGLVDAAKDFFDAQAATIYMLDAERGELYFAAARGPRARELLALDRTLQPGEGLAGSCFSQNEVIALSDAGGDPRFAKEISDAVGYAVSSVLSAPISCDGEPLGVLQLLNKNGATGFTPDDVEAAGQLGRLAGGLVGLGLRLQDLTLRAGVGASGEEG